MTSDGGSPASELPRIDEHRVAIAAEPAAVWDALLATLGESFSGRAPTAYARLIRGRPARASGPRPLAAGSEVPGFRVVRAEPANALELEGRHLFSRYALRFRLDPQGTTTELAAESLAEFPGPHGRAYRLLVISTRGHVVGVRRLLAAVRRRAEKH